MRITAVQGDITEQDVDAIVNAANSVMRGGGGVDGAIHRAGGPAILQDCIDRFPEGLATGDAGWTTAGDLSAGWVIHTVGPTTLRGNKIAGCCNPVTAAPSKSQMSSAPPRSLFR
jgi:O-acetyl-ADP-ribose deacetylase (regulator of RNase III)